MRVISATVVSALMCALVACSDGEPESSTFPVTASATHGTTSETASAPVSADEETAPTPADETPAPSSDSNEADDEPDWMKDCLPFVPCFPPDPPPADDADACPPFDPICQTNAAIHAGESK